MFEFSSPTPLATAISSLAFLIIASTLFAIFSLVRPKKKANEDPGFFERILSGVRWLDRSLVDAFSWVTGTRYRHKLARVSILLIYFLVLTAGAVFLTWPFGMLAIGLGVFSIFIVFRHWSRDEDEAVDGVPFERKHIKINGNLGTEVLIAVGFLFVFAPIAFAKLQTYGTGFTLAADAGPFTFLLYTFIETVKAGSLVDYYDLYADRIGLEKIGVPSDPSNWAKATIMGYRVSLNLLVLAAIKRLIDIAKRRSDGADLRAVEEALRAEDKDKQQSAIDTLQDFAMRGRGNARDLLEKVAEPRQSEAWPIAPETRFAASGALLDYGTQRGGASALYAAADGYRALMREGFDRQDEPKRWRAAALNLGNTLVQLGQQIGDPERLKDAARIYDELLENTDDGATPKSKINAMIVRSNVFADLAMMTGAREDLERAVTQYRAALSSVDDETDRTQVGQLRTNLGATLADIAEIDADVEIISEAVTVYREALPDLSAESDPETWSMAQNNLGNALADLGHWTSSSQSLKDAIKAHEQALTVRRKNDMPLLWAMSQTNLANALTRLAKAESSGDTLNQAVDHYQSAQSVYQREEFPRDWSWAEASLGAAQIDLGHMTGNAAAFEKAVQFCDGAAGGYSSAKMPSKKAWALSLKGNALVGLERYEEAATAFQAAREWQTFENAGDDWVMSTNNLAACLFEIGRSQEAVDLLQGALTEQPDDPRLSATLAVLQSKTTDPRPVE